MSAIEREVVGLESEDLPRAGWGAYRRHGQYLRPAGSPPPRVAFIATHYNIDFAQHYLGPYLAARGFGFLGWNTRFCGTEAYFALEPALEDVAAGVEWLRAAGVQTVVLLGNSGGASVMAAFQATHGTGDLYVSLAAHPGRPDVLTGWLDPAVIDESDPVATDASLYMYDPANGPPYSPEFVARYRSAQVERNHRITSWVHRELERLGDAGYPDGLFSVRRVWADPRFVDPALDPSDRPTPACYAGDPARANRGTFGLASLCSLRTWLAMWSLEESPCRASLYLRSVTVPSIVIHATMDAGVFPSDARAIHDGLGAADKGLVALPGDHYFRGEDRYREDLADVVAEWASGRV